MSKSNMIFAPGKLIFCKNAEDLLVEIRTRNLSNLGLNHDYPVVLEVLGEGDTTGLCHKPDDVLGAISTAAARLNRMIGAYNYSLGIDN